MVQMGPFRVNIQIGDLQGQQFESAEALVDAGASDTVIPRPILERLEWQYRAAGRLHRPTSVLWNMT